MNDMDNDVDKEPEKESGIVIYSTPTCPYCKRAKDYFQRNNIEFTEYNVAKDRKAAKEMIKKSGQLGVPVIIINGELIIGFNQTQLDEILAKSA